MLIEVTDALIGLGGLLLGSGITYLGTKRTSDTNLKIAREKLEADNRLSNAASASMRALLLEPDWELRSFDAIRKRMRGFSDDELRKLLVAGGALAFEERGSGRELWGLRERNVEKLRPGPDQQPLESEPSMGLQRR